MSEVLDVFVQPCSSIERWDERLRGAKATAMAKSPRPDCQENPTSEFHSRSYRNPTQVDYHKHGKALEITLLKELGKMTP